MFNELPPDPLLRIFTQGQENLVQRVSRMRCSVSIGDRVNTGVEEVIPRMKDDINTLESSLTFTKHLKARGWSRSTSRSK